jgi:hypothetical protein
LQPFTTAAIAFHQLSSGSSTLIQYGSAVEASQRYQDETGVTNQFNSTNVYIAPFQEKLSTIWENVNIGANGANFYQMPLTLTLAGPSTATYWLNLLFVYKCIIAFRNDGNVRMYYKYSEINDGAVNLPNIV